MKKLLFVLAIGAFAACGTKETKETTGDTTMTDTAKVVTHDTATVVTDTTIKVDTISHK